MGNFDLIFSARFRKDFKKISKDSGKLLEVRAVFALLLENGVENIPVSMKPHKLKGNWKDHWECHIRPDLLIIWLQVHEPTKTIYLERIGSHSDIFKK